MFLFVLVVFFGCFCFLSFSEIPSLTIFVIRFSFCLHILCCLSLSLLLCWFGVSYQTRTHPASFVIVLLSDLPRFLLTPCCLQRWVFEKRASAGLLRKSFVNSRGKCAWRIRHRSFCREQLVESLKRESNKTGEQKKETRCWSTQSRHDKNK